MFGRIKDWRRIATRYDRCAHSFFSSICSAATVCFYLNQLVMSLARERDDLTCASAGWALSVPNAMRGSNKSCCFRRLVLPSKSKTFHRQPHFAGWRVTPATLLWQIAPSERL
jgi:hypothetical protein